MLRMNRGDEEKCRKEISRWMARETLGPWVEREDVWGSSTVGGDEMEAGEAKSRQEMRNVAKRTGWPAKRHGGRRRSDHLPNSDIVGHLGHRSTAH